ncbi:hypothetical protein G5714_023712 [Onychostoma macrolepis]|uniref:Uncharacterized protein n=1 Tax=Onychostoma macrolepis TaxID=369639 RepID=A0A7J6BM29_9TELE|nr:hypothetical protein G5714_023712 [Onychostoma macrolepis]
MSASSEPVNPSVLPKHRPAYLQDYEVDLQSFRKSVSPREQPVESSDEDYSSSERHISSPAHQSSPHYPNRELQSESNAEFVPLVDEGDGYQSDRSDASSLKLQRISGENLKLCETQQAIQADHKWFETTKHELIQLLDRACSLQRPLSTSNTRSDHPSVTFHHAANQGDQDWPKPPPPIAYDEP